MDNQYRSTFIFIGFCLAVLLLIFLPDAGYTISLIIRGSAIAGLVYAVYFYYHYLGLASGNVHHSEQGPEPVLTSKQEQAHNKLDVAIWSQVAQVISDRYREQLLLKPGPITQRQNL